MGLKLLVRSSSTMLGNLRPYVKNLKTLLAWPYLKLGFSATQVGLFGVGMAGLAAALARMGRLDWAFWLALIAVLTDMADGEVARTMGQESPAGNYIDALGDRLREGLLLLGLFPLAPNLVLLALLGSFLTSFAKARCALVVVMDNRDWPGFGDHPDRAVLLLCAYAWTPQSLIPLGILVISSWLCCIVRVRYALRLIEEAKSEELLPYLRFSAKYQR